MHDGNVRELPANWKALYELQRAELHAQYLRVANVAAREQRNKARGERYRLSRLLEGLRERNAWSVAPREWEASEEIARAIGREPRAGFAFVPVSHDALWGRRDLSVAASGGYLVSTEVAPGDMFVGAMRAASILERLGVLRVPVRGDALIPRLAGDVTTYWLADETTPITESSMEFSFAAGTPRTVGAYVEVSSQILRQTSSAAQAFVLRELGRAMAAEVGAKFLIGSGVAGQPLGLLNQPGLASVSGASLDWTATLSAIGSVEDANGIIEAASAAWALPSDVAELLRQRDVGTDSGRFILANGAISDYRAVIANSVPAATAVFGDWSSAALFEWGVLEIGADPYGVNSALWTRGLVGLRATWSVDVVVQRLPSFIKVASIT